MVKTVHSIYYLISHVRVASCYGHYLDYGVVSERFDHKVTIRGVRYFFGVTDCRLVSRSEVYYSTYGTKLETAIC